MSWQPADPDALADVVADWLSATPGRTRIAVDGAPAADPMGFAAALAPLLERAGRPVGVVDARTFWRDASVRLEHGREDVDAYLDGWLDAEALRREVLEPVHTAGTYLRALRDPDTNRSVREPVRPLAKDGLLLVAGSLLLRPDLPFDRTIHLALSAGALRRRTSEDQVWTLEAYARYDGSVRPAESADLVVKLDDLRHPALRFRAGPRADRRATRRRGSG